MYKGARKKERDCGNGRKFETRQSAITALLKEFLPYVISNISVCMYACMKQLLSSMSAEGTF